MGLVAHNLQRKFIHTGLQIWGTKIEVLECIAPEDHSQQLAEAHILFNHLEEATEGNMSLCY